MSKVTLKIEEETYIRLSSMKAEKRDKSLSETIDKLLDMRDELKILKDDNK